MPGFVVTSFSILFILLFFDGNPSEYKHIPKWIPKKETTPNLIILNHSEMFSQTKMFIICAFSLSPRKKSQKKKVHMGGRPSSFCLCYIMLHDGANVQILVQE